MSKVTRLLLGLILFALYLPGASRAQTGQQSDASYLNADSQDSGTHDRTIRFKPEGYDEQQGELPSSLVIPTAQGNLKLEFQDDKGSSLPSDSPEAAHNPHIHLPIGLWLSLLAVFFIFMSILRQRQKEAAPPEPVSNPDVTAGGTWGTFAIVRIIGQGGMGIVYEAIDQSLERKVALKRMRDEIKQNSAEMEQFLKEAKTVANLHHPNIVTIHSIIRQANEIFLVFEYVEGKPLDVLLREKGRLALPQAQSILGRVCEALDFAHGHRVIHRDLKPSNIMITTQGQVKVMDFGIARRIKDTAAKASLKNAPADLTNTIVGTPIYMAPEAERGLICPEGDIYALGVILYQLLSGQAPFPPPASALQKMERGYPRLSENIQGLPKEIDRLVDDCLEPEPSKRIHTSRQFWARLAPLALS